MRISDWSSDVCSSDLLARADEVMQIGARPGRADGAGTVGIERRLILGEFGVANIDRPVAGKRLPVAARPRRQYAIEHVDPARDRADQIVGFADARSEEHTSELQSLMRISYAVFCLKKKKHNITN